MAAKIAWALDIEGIYRHVTEVANGKACNCKCLDCGEPLIACHPNPIMKTSYFAHYNNADCSGESVLHKVAKQILEELAQEKFSIVLAEYYGKAIGRDLIGGYVYSNHRQPNNLWEMASCTSEVNIGPVVLDSLAVNETGQMMGIEIYVRNKKTDTDISKFEKLNIKVMEINLSKTSWSVDRNNLALQILQSAERRWLNSLAKHEAQSIAEKQLPQLIASRDNKINYDFNKLVQDTISNSYRNPLHIVTLTSEIHILNNKQHISLKKRSALKI